MGGGIITQPTLGYLGEAQAVATFSANPWGVEKLKACYLVKKVLNRVIQALVLSLWGLSAMYACPAFAQTSTQASGKPALEAVVGQASLVIGVVKVIHLQGQEEILEKDGLVRVGDQLFTNAAGHVHLLFVDGARISVRPQSHLIIEDYSPASAKTEASIRFRLEQGAMRSITGSWGEENHERFRLNTPLAAIGIKGTDFVVKSEAHQTLASVITGAIVLSPLSSPCAANLGACQNGHDLTLTAQMQGQMLQLQKGQAAPSLVPAFDLLASKKNETISSTTSIANGSTGTSNTNTASVQNLTVVAAATDQIFNAVGPQAPIDLFWGRFPWTATVAGDGFVQSASAAFQAGMQLLAGNGAYTLYRDPGAHPIYSPTATSATFQLKESLASLYLPATYSYQPVQVSQGALSVNFVNNTFNTQLSMSSPALGNTTMNSQGVINATGVMRGTSGDAALTGGLNTTGTAAGYAFSKVYQQGTVNGITLWGR